MFQRIGSMFGDGGIKPKSTHIGPKSGITSPTIQRAGAERQPTYSKVFRWVLPEDAAQEPSVVEIVGSFTGWQKVPLLRDPRVKTWHATIQEIPGNRTHHYMLLVDGTPTMDAGCDGYALPQDETEDRFAIQTARGRRVFMLFAQTK
jgi:hypothetical protein